MSEFSTSELRRLDLTLLLVFLGLLRHRRALDVAAELGLTQSAISQALKRLRDIFGDDLFLRRPHGMEPTALALALEPPVAAAVEALTPGRGPSAGRIPAAPEARSVPVTVHAPGSPGFSAVRSIPSRRDAARRCVRVRLGLASRTIRGARGPSC